MYFSFMDIFLKKQFKQKRSFICISTCYKLSPHSCRYLQTSLLLAYECDAAALEKQSSFSFLICITLIDALCLAQQDADTIISFS